MCPDAGTPTTSTLLLSSGYDSYTGGSTAYGDITFWEPGELFDVNGTPYAVPGATTPGPFEFQILTWTGTQYTSYAAAVGKPNTYTGRSGVFAENTCYSIMPPFPNFGWINNMPAFTMQQQLPGDANGDGKVDINDLTIVLANYNQTGMNWNGGDFTGSGTVDINDLTIVLAHYNQSVGSGGAAGVGTVPEPGAGPAGPGADRSAALGGAASPAQAGERDASAKRKQEAETLARNASQ